MNGLPVGIALGLATDNLALGIAVRTAIDNAESAQEEEDRQKKRKEEEDKDN